MDINRLILKLTWQILVSGRIFLTKMTSKTAVSVCRVCGVKIPFRCALCHECARNAADHFMFNFHVDKAEGRRMLAKTFASAGVDRKKLRGIDVRDRFPMAFKATNLSGKTGFVRFQRFSGQPGGGRIVEHSSSRKARTRATKFRRMAKGTRKIKEYFE